MNIFAPYIFLLIGIVSLLFAMFSKSTYEQLKQKGEVCEGIIFQLDYSSNDSFHSDSTIARDKITIRFVTNKQEWITGEPDMNLMITSTGQFQEGQKVQVLYNPDKPSQFTLLEGQAPRTIRMGTVIMGFVFITIGVYLVFTQES